jgi:hypothetical protein
MNEKPQVLIVVDGFAEYVSGISNDEVYVLLAAIEEHAQSQNELFPDPLKRLKQMYNILIEEFHERELDPVDFVHG